MGNSAEEYLGDNLVDNEAYASKIKKAKKCVASQIKALQDKKRKTSPNVSIQLSAVQSSVTSRVGGS